MAKQVVGCRLVQQQQVVSKAAVTGAYEHVSWSAEQSRYWYLFVGCATGIEGGPLASG